MIRTTLAQANQFILHKNFLASKNANSAAHVAEALAGLPASPRLTPFLAARIRLADFSPDQILHNNQLVCSPLLRSTPYFVPAERFAVWYAATARQRNQALNAEFRLWGLDTNAEVEQLGAQILAQLDDRPVTEAEISERVSPVKELTQTSRGGRISTTTNVVLALHWLVATAQVAQDYAADWRREQPVYRPFSVQYPDLDLSDLPAEAEAQKQVVRAYLAAFGPATEADISFWTGFGKSETARAIGALNRETELTLVPGIPGMLLMLKSQAEALAATTAHPPQPVVNILPADDPYLTAHRASRIRYFADHSLQRQVFSGSGTSKPVVLINGQVAGVWQWMETEGVSWQPLDYMDSALTTAVEAELARLANFMGVQQSLGDGNGG